MPASEACRVDTHANWVCDQVWSSPVCSATETTWGIEFLPEVGLSVTISTDKYAGFDIIAVRSVPLLLLAAATSYTNRTGIKFSGSYLP